MTNPMQRLDHLRTASTTARLSHECLQRSLGGSGTGRQASLDWIR